MILFLSLLLALGLGFAAVGAPREAFLVLFWLAAGAFGWNLGAAISSESARRARRAAR